jgi:predicted nuclease of predicted toxin-antitoxin system
VRFLLDQNLSARLASLLTDAGHDAVHVAALGLSRANDLTILDRAADEGRVLISADTDFSMLLAQAHRRRPSLILFRRERPRRAPAQATLLLGHLDRLTADLDEGAIVVLEEARVRIRRLPIIPDE